MTDNVQQYVYSLLLLKIEQLEKDHPNNETFDFMWGRRRATKKKRKEFFVPEKMSTTVDE